MIITLCRHEDGRPVAMIPANGKKENCEVSEARALVSPAAPPKLMADMAGRALGFRPAKGRKPKQIRLHRRKIVSHSRSSPNSRAAAAEAKAAQAANKERETGRFGDHDREIVGNHLPASDSSGSPADSGECGVEWGRDTMSEISVGIAGDSAGGLEVAAEVDRAADKQ